MRHELAAEKSLRVNAMERQNVLDAEIAALMQRTAQSEAQSLSSRRELEALRQQLKHREINHAAFELLAIPATTSTLKLPHAMIPVRRSEPKHVGQQVGQPQPCTFAQYDGLESPVQRYRPHDGRMEGFIQTMPQPAAKLRKSTVRERLLNGCGEIEELPDSLTLLQRNVPVEQSMTCALLCAPLTQG